MSDRAVSEDILHGFTSSFHSPYPELLADPNWLPLCASTTRYAPRPSRIREETLKHYCVLIQNSKYQRYHTFFDLKVDTVYFHHVNPLLDGARLITIPSAVRHSFQLLEFDHMWWSDGFKEVIEGSEKAARLFQTYNGFRECWLWVI